MPIPARFTERYLVDWVKSKLGEPMVQVELDEPQIKDAINDTVDAFQRYRPKQKIEGEILAQGTHVRVGPDNNMGLLDVEWLETDAPGGLADAFGSQPILYGTAWTLGGVEVQLQVAYEQWRETVAQVFGDSFGYEITDEGVFIYCPKSLKVRFTWALPYEGLDDVRREYHEIFRKIVLAKSRQVLGAIRSKYAGVPAAGGMVQMDGEWLREKGAADEEKYTDELMRLSPHYIPSYG